ncbi:hypothetical protein PPL_00106 [Heterostelium album PN500]|uniref:Uncharacterized protein n=1 Tax=Heterostelium pallidum (strain ATCC 26659 / Pp 5 / PN500) TaxID=670386 RepID=D3AVJ3_HETP5|nr:hypothetical protein PPL_00106 [Heterostelium album PN500]EFA86316.1 hypothetical protein PPL_00106 [Heterostelium album PN500]|eukprot:XP_020438421.1 hypothetical protein PPL_00106 [Heterostelium album PN500]
MAPRFDASLVPLYVILGTAAAFTVGFGVRTMSTHNDLSLTRKTQMLFMNNDAPKLIAPNTSAGFYHKIHSGSYLKDVVNVCKSRIKLNII